MELAQTIREIADPIIARYDGYVVDVIVRGERGTRIVEIFVDTDEGVTADICAEVSREISAVLDSKDLIQGRYRLDVSSPGLDRPLKFHRQYQKNINRMLKINYTSDNETKTITGVLKSVSDSTITIELNNQEPLDISITQIQKAVVEPQFRRQE